MHATPMFNLTAAAAPVIGSPTGYSLYSNLDGGFGEASRRTATHQMPYGLRTHRLIREVESTSCSENTWWERVDRRPEHGPASRRSLDSSVFRILKQENLENDDENHGRRGNFLDDFFRFDSHTNSHPGQPSRLDKENKGDSNLSSQSGSARPGNPIPVPSNIDATQFEPNYNIPLEQIEHEFMVLSGGFTDTDWSSFPVWAFDMDLTSKNQWIDLSGLNVGHAFNENREDPTEHLIWPDGRVGHISAIHDGYLHVFGGLLWKDKAFVVEKVPYIWKTKIGDKLNVVLSDASSSSPHNKSVLEWERIMPKIRTYNSSNKNGTRHGSFSSGEHDKDPAQSDHTLTRGECRGGHWAGGSGLVFYGGLHVQHQLSGHEHENKEDIALGDVWMYNYTSETLEQLSPYPPPKSQRDEDGRYPIARTAHAATIVGNKLYIYGGMTSSAWSPTRGNGDGVWDELSDLWIFDLIERKWSERIMTPYLSRSYHSMVGWGDDSLAVFGGFRTAQTISGEPVAFVFSDTLISKPKNDMDSNLHQWWKVECNDAKGGLPHYEEGASNRLEHTASVDKFGNMLLFGGRFKSVSQVTGMWSINIFGQNSDLSLTPATPDGLEAYEAELEALHMLVAVMMLMSILFTALYGTLRQQAAQHEGGGGGGLGILSRRNGLSREAIDALPTKMYGESDTDDSAQPPESAADNVSDTSGLSDVPLEEEECCPICLVEYEQGDELRCLPCNHEFHRTCVDSWLEHHTSCPACRHALSNTVPEPATQENTTTSDGIWRFDYSMEPLGMTTGLSLGQLLTTRNHSGFRRAVHPGQQGAENSGEVSPDDHDDTFHDEDAAEDSSQRRPFRLRRYLRLPFTPSDAADDTLGDTELTTIPNNSAA